MISAPAAQELFTRQLKRRSFLPRAKDFLTAFFYFYASFLYLLFVAQQLS